MTTTADMPQFADHELAPGYEFSEIRYEKRPLITPNGEIAEGLFNVWIWLDNPKQYNSYTTRAMAELILALRKASNERDVVCVVFTAVGEKAFCTGGNTAEYSEHYSGRPDEYRRYMRIFNDGVSALMTCDKPVINRVNGMRIAGGQEIGMACDFTISADTARFGQAGPKHGSAPVGGSTDFLPLFVGMALAMDSGTLCETWSAHYALQIGLINDLAPVLKVDGAFIPNPMVHTEFVTDAYGRSLYGQPVEGDAFAAAKATMKSAEVDFELLDAAVEKLCGKLALTMPECTTVTIEQLRKHKLEYWNRNKESNRAWLALNMMTEGRMGFRTFNRAPREEREADFLEMRRALAEGVRYGDKLSERAAPHAVNRENEQ